MTLPRLKPMLATPATSLPEGENWAFEIKWDGIRALVYASPDELLIHTRNQNDVTHAYPELQGLREAVAPHSVILDGEIVALDENGKPSFQLLQQRMNLSNPAEIARRARNLSVIYVIFDFLYVDEQSCLAMPYAQRRTQLEQFDLNGPSWSTPEYNKGDGEKLREITESEELEGVIAKRLDSIYQPGKRTLTWLKIRNWQRERFVVGGWIPGKGKRANRIGSLLVGYYGGSPEADDSEGDFHYAGSVGSGLSESELEQLEKLLAPLERKDSPFDGRQPAAGVRFVEPQLRVEVQFSEWTARKQLRQPVYVGLVSDDPSESAAVEDAESATPGKYAPTAAPDLGLGETKVEVEVENRRLALSNLNKVLYPHTGFTKAQVIDYYARIAPVILPHLENRAVTLKRFPAGVEQPFFYEKNCPRYRPNWVKTARMFKHLRNGRGIESCLINDLPTLIWTANLAALELHTSLGLVEYIYAPTMVVFDLDPGPPAGLAECCEVALKIEGMLSKLNLQSFPKTSGSKGLQVYVPLNVEADFEETKNFAREVANTLARAYPDHVVAKMTKRLRTGKVFIDWSQNVEHKTTVCAYSLRAREFPTVSTPLSWDEIRTAHDSGNGESLVFDSEAVIRRVEAMGDLFAPVLTLQQQLPS